MIDYKGGKVVWDNSYNWERSNYDYEQDILQLQYGENCVIDVGNYGDAHMESRILIHCEGGISRSPALAIGALVKFGLDIPSACEYVHQQRPNMAPNNLILSHCERALQLDGLLVHQVKKVVSQYDKGLVLWCDKCQAHFIDGQNCPGKHFQDVLPDEGIYV